MRIGSNRKTDALNIAVLVGLWIIAVVLVNPTGTFPLNDDFTYAKTVLTLLRDGTYNPTRWPVMTLLTHVLWGALFCVPFGFSFTALRLSILFLGLGGVILTYFLFKAVQAPRSISFIAAALLAFNPIYFALSNTYMADVTFAAFSLVVILFSIRQLQNDSNPSWIWITVFSVAAVLCRQFGLFLPFVYGIAYSCRRGFSKRSLVKGWIPFIFGLTALLFFQGWLHSRNSEPAYVRQLWRLPLLFKNVYSFILYAGLFLFPFLIMLPSSKDRTNLKSLLGRKGLFFLVLLGISLAMIFNNRLMPLGVNILNNWGIGPSNLRDIDILYLPHLQHMPWTFWKLATLISVVGSGLLLLHMGLLTKRLWNGLRNRQIDDRMAISIFLYLNIVIYFFFIVWMMLFDRYIIPLIPQFALLIFLSWRHGHPRPLQPKKAAVAVSLALCAFSWIFSIAGARDYLSTNRMRWKMLRVLVEEKSIPPAKIDGGYEFNGWYLYRDDYVSKKNKSWWWVEDDDYLVSMGPMAGYDVIQREELFRWLTFKRDAIYVLHRKEVHLR